MADDSLMNVKILRVFHIKFKQITQEHSDTSL